MSPLPILLRIGNVKHEVKQNNFKLQNTGIVYCVGNNIEFQVWKTLYEVILNEINFIFESERS